MTKQKQRALIELFSRLEKLGFTYEQSVQLRRIEMTLHRWDEQECGDSNDFNSWAIERDEVTNKPYRVVYPHQGKSYRTPIADREAGAMRRLKAIIDARNQEWLEANYDAFPGDLLEQQKLVAYHQGDCRGAALYIIRKADLIQDGKQLPIDSYYTRGLCVAA